MTRKKIQWFAGVRSSALRAFLGFFLGTGFMSEDLLGYTHEVVEQIVEILEKP